jgi:hypothetical protein
MGVIVHQIARRASGLCALLDSALNTVSSALNSSWQRLPAAVSCAEEILPFVGLSNRLG